MNLTSFRTIKSLCKKYHFWPSRKSGQNFLISQDVLEKIIQGANLNSQDLVLEIGAGFGTLTFALASRVKKVIACELDKRLVKALRDLLIVQNVQDVESVKNVEVVQGDIFKQWPVASNQLSDGQYKLVSNLPYNITSLVLRNFLEKKPRPREMTLLVQKEVAERVVAKPGAMSLLSVACQFLGQPEIVGYAPRDNFWPKPDVDSAILRLRGILGDNRGYKGLLGDISVKNFFGLVKMGFSAKRKQLQNNLAGGLRISNEKIKKYLEDLGLNPQVRAQDLSLDNWLMLAQKLKPKKFDPAPRPRGGAR